jgi:ethanolamine utilization protein EutQ (cupin superfamily)
MANKVLGNLAIEEIRGRMRGLTGSPAKREAARLAAIHGVNWQHIYKVTADLRIGTRKKRSDAGKRTFELVEGTDVWQAAQYVISDKLDPNQALLTVRLRNPDALLPSLEYFRRMLAEKQLGKKHRKANMRAFRRFEAEFPGEIFQIDVTALKIRWKDEKTRRIQCIEGVDKNHPNMDPTKLRVWQIMLVDDHSRRRFLRYVATTHITSAEMVRFECEAYQHLGVPHSLYTDNGSEFKGYHIRAEKILNKVLAGDGGYRHITHLPGNAQATGKCENAHQWAEKADRYVGLAITEGQDVTIEKLNAFADNIVSNHDLVIHRGTKQRPIDRWHATKTLIRTLDPAVIESALLSDEFEVVLNGSMTVSHKGKSYKVPGEQPFVNFIGQKVKIVVPHSIAMILIALPDGAEYELEKVLATADRAGEFRSTADSTAQTLTKRLRQTRKEEIRAIRAKQKLTGEIAPVPHFNVKIEQPASNISHFPHPERVFSAAEIGAVAPVVNATASDAVDTVGTRTPSPVPVYSSPIGYWQAVAEFGTYFDSVDDAKTFLLGLYPGEAGDIPKIDVEAAIRSRDAIANQKLLRAV